MTLRAAFATTVSAAVLAMGCGWSPRRPLDRESPTVASASLAIDGGRAAEAVEALTGYLATGPCDDGAIGTPASLVERPRAAYDLGLAISGQALPPAARFGPRVTLTDESQKKERGARVACALRVVRAFLAEDGLEAELRSRARYLEGNLLAIDERYDEALEAYARALVRSPAEADGGSPVDRDLAWNRSVVLAWREEARRDAGAPDGGGGGDGGTNPDGGGGNEAGTPDGGAPPDGGGTPDGSTPDGGGQPNPPDAGADAGRDAGGDGKNQADAGSPPEAGAPPPPRGAMSDEDLLDRLARAPTLQREAIRRQAKQSRGLIDK